MSARLVESGTVLADRYVIEDLLAEEGESHSWRALDQVLARSVVLHVLPSSSPFAEPLLAAAKRSSRVADPRILHVLDAVNDGELTYVVREWATGQSLDVVLSDGPLPARRAAWLVREVAAAMTEAHSLSVTHRRLAPDTIVLASSSGVKILGLGTFSALHGETGPDDAEREDTMALGQLLYACLTARWPGEGCPSLPVAPVEHGRWLRPRQVRAGVPRALDEICDRILSRPPRHGVPITTAAEVKSELSALLTHDLPSSGALPPTVTAHPAIPAAIDPPPALLRQEAAGESSPDPAPRATATPPARWLSSGKTLVWPAIAVVVLGVMLLAYLVGHDDTNRAQDNPPSSTTPSTTPPAPPPPRPLQIAAARSFDPFPGSGDEHPELVPLAYDGDRSTAWETFSYESNPALGGLKDGVGLLLDLGGVQKVQQVTVALQGTGTALELRAAPKTASAPPAESAQDYRLLETVTDAGSRAVFRLEQPRPARYLLLWLTSLPPEDSDSYRGKVAEVKVFG